MGYFADGIDISTLAKNVQNRAASWSMAGRRGANIKIPGRPGSIHVDKPEDDNQISLDMWARGAEEDGSFPISGTAEAKCVDQLDQLARIFGSGKLIELVRAADTVAYGRTNLIPNPSLEKSGGEQVVRENIINNPSAEYSSGKTTVRRNFAINPGMEDGIRKETLRTNFAINPRFGAEGQETVRRTNLFPNPSFEAGIRPWGSNNNCTFSREKFSLGATWPSNGKWSAKMKSLASGVFSINSGPIRVSATTAYAIQFKMLNQSGVSLNVVIKTKWRNRAGGNISTTTSSTTALADGVVTLLSTTPTSPALAYRAIVTVEVTATAAAQVVYLDSAGLEAGSTVLPYFDGDSDEVDMYRFRWTDEAGFSHSEAYTVAAVGWRTTDDGVNRIFGLTNAQAKRGAMSLRVAVVGSTLSGNQIIRQQVKYGANIEPGTIISARIAVRQGDTIVGTRTLSLQLRCLDADNTSLGLAYNAGTTTAMTPVVGALGQADWNEVLIENVQVRPKTAKVIIEGLNGETWNDGDYVYFDEAIIEDTAVAGPYFDGSIRNQDVLSYEWEGDTHLSESYTIGATVENWDTVSGYLYRNPGNARIGDFSGRLEAYRNPASALRPMAFSKAIDIRAGRSHTLSAYVRPNRTVSIALARSLDAGATWSLVGAASATANVWTRLSNSAVIPAGTDPEKVMIGVSYNAAGVDGDTLDFESVLFEPVGFLDTYFDGNTGKNYEWAGDEHQSVSRFLDWQPDGWLPDGTGFPVLYRDAIIGAGGDGLYETRIEVSEAGTAGVTFGQQGINPGDTYGFGVDYYNATGALSVQTGIDFFGANGAVVQTSNTASTPTAATRTRVAHTAVAPSTAVAGAPWVLIQGATAGMLAGFDRALFGFGSTTTYADGDSGGGWKWTGAQDQSDSYQYATVPYNWRADGGTFVQDSGYVSDRTLGGLYTVVSGTGPWRIYARNNGEGSAERFRVTGQPVMWSLDVRATDAARVQMQLVPAKWTGWGWATTTSPTISGTATNLAAGGTSRLSVVGTPGSTGDATHYLPMLSITANPGGGTPTAGVRVRVDSGMLEPNGSASDITYIDGGNGFWKRWNGDEDNSSSQVVGPARRALVENISPIDPTSFHGDLARFSVELIMPEVYWEDTVYSTATYILGKSGSVLTLFDWDGCSAPINDADIWLYGGFNDLRITDYSSGAWIQMDGRFHNDEGFYINNKDWIVTKLNGKDNMDDMSHDGSPFLLPLTPVTDEDAPRLKFTAKAIGKGAKIKIRARRKYRVA